MDRGIYGAELVTVTGVSLFCFVFKAEGQAMG
jgi:hypothetical protein